jgi:methylated-DNA-[protein]-cysteine S-methyltransferase
LYYSTTYSSPLGTVTLACDSYEKNLVGLWLEGQKYYGSSMANAMTPKDNIPLFGATKGWLDRYFDGKKPENSELPLAPVGTEFRQVAWQILCEIPYGKVVSYGDIAKQMAVKCGKKKMSAQAVGGAVGHNPISIIIPCHRVVGSNGSLTGYAGGIETKVKLLKLEGVDMSSLYVPVTRT